MGVKKQESQSDKINKLIKNVLNLLSIDAISNSALQAKNTDAIINEKLENEKRSIEYGINSINKNVLKKQDKYSNVFEEEEKLLNEYKEILYSSSKFYDNSIYNESLKILKEELFQVEKNKELMILNQNVIKAKEKADNSDDEIDEKIYSVEEEISKSETKVKRAKTLMRNKIKEKESELYSAIESKNKEVQREIRGPRVIKSATRFFMGKLNPLKMIEKNVFSLLRKRIDDYKKSYDNILNKKVKLTSDNIVDNINELVKKTEKKLL